MDKSEENTAKGNFAHVIFELDKISVLKIQPFIKNVKGFKIHWRLK